MQLNILREISGIQVHYADDRHCISSKNLTILGRADTGTDWRKLIELPSHPIENILLNLLLYSRLVRGGIHSILPIGGSGKPDWIVVAQRKIYLVSSTNHQVDILFQIKRGRRPLRRGLCVTADRVVLGEYWSNTHRKPVNIYVIKIPTGQVDTLYQFDKNTVRHIHTVEQDPYSDSLWISTGDNDSECMIALINQRTGQLETIGQGSQKWRTVSFAFRPEAVYWGTDNHSGENQIWRFDRATWATQVIDEVIGPVYYNVCLKDFIVFGTTVEKGEGQQDGFGRLYAVDIYHCVREVWKQRKDHWDPCFFGYGIFEFAEGHRHDNKFWVTAKGFENGLHSILFELQDE